METKNLNNIATTILFQKQVVKDEYIVPMDLFGMDFKI